MELLINGFTLFGLEIRFYGILMASAFIVGLLIVMYFCKKKGYSSNLPYDLILIVFPSAIVGARLNYVLFTLKDGDWTFVKALQIWNGGLMIYGGIIFAVIAIAIYCLVKKINFVSILDMLAPVLILGQAIGRWGNFFNQEAYGSLITNPSFHWFPFGVYIENAHFTEAAEAQLIEAYGSSNMAGAWFNATFFYESMWCLLGFVLLYFIFTKTNKKGFVAATYLTYYGFERFFVEQLRTDSLYLGSIRVSVLISGVIFLFGAGYLTYLLIKDYKLKKLKMSLDKELVSAGGSGANAKTNEPKEEKNKTEQKPEITEQNKENTQKTDDDDISKNAT